MRKSSLLFHAVAVLFVPAGLAETLTDVPMQGSMVMPMLAYHAADGSLTVLMDPTIPQLTPLLVSNPGDSFDPADPWYDCLDPSRQGLAFSRRYGFVMDVASDPLPPGTALWIRKLSGPPELGAYRYRKSIPKAWEPIFGTSGTTNALWWNLSMFHPCFTAPPGTGTFTATFEAFLLYTADGSPVPGANTGPFIFNWTVVPDGRPILNIALSQPNQVVISWPAATTNYVLETADGLPASSWIAVTNAPFLLNGQMAVMLHPTAGTRLFRMRLAP